MVRLVVLFAWIVGGMFSLQALATTNPMRDVAVAIDNVCVLINETVTCTCVSEITRVPTLVRPTKIGVAPKHACAITAEGVKCWGDNQYNQTDIPLLVDPTQIDEGSRHNCALTANGVRCWGENELNQNVIPPLNNPRSVMSGTGQNCAITNDGVVCWHMPKF